MRKFNFKELLKLPSVVRLPKDLEQQYRNEQRHGFVSFFRTAALFGFIAYTLMIAVDWFTAKAAFFDILMPRLTMQGMFIMAFAISFHKKFYIISQYVGMLFFMIFMANVVWVQGVMEQKLEEGYGMLITPDAASSIIVFSGAEVGYGALLTPLLLLPIAFTGLQSFIVSALVVIGINIGMQQSQLPEAFVETANSIFITLGIFTSILAFLVNQHRRSSFKLQHDLQEANDGKSSVLAAMSHEVRTPLTGMLGMAALLEDTPLNTTQKDYVQTVRYSGETLLAMLNDILDFSKMEAGKFEIENIDIDFSMLTRSVADLMRSRAEEKGITIKTNIGEQVPLYIHSDPTRLRQVLLNLLSNAIKFTEKGHVGIGVSCIKTMGESALLRFEVTDSGIGMSQEVMDKLFQEFSQADSSTSRKYGGTGLGLSICKQIVELMGGDIEVSSVIGEGSCFSFEIVVDIASAPAENESSSPTATKAVKPLTILLVEDDQTIARYTSTLLQTQQHDITVATCGEEVFEITKTQNFDLVLMDYNLTDMKGSEITARLKDLDYFDNETPIIGLTGNTHQPIIDECFESGMVDYLVKPVNKNKLIATLSQYGSHAPVTTGTGSSESIGNQAITAMINDFGPDYAKEMIQDFITGIEEKLVELEAAVNGQNNKDILHSSHDITSMAGTVGLSESSEMFGQIESNVMHDPDRNTIELLQKAQEIYLQEKSEIDEFLAA